jgi:hypothetical protein
MFGFLKRYFAYRQLRPVVAALPARLAKAYGPAPHYTFGQAKRAIGDLKIGGRAVPHAFAAACSVEELEANGAEISGELYRALRAELAELFGLRSTDFTMQDLQSRSFNSHHPAAENVYAQGGHP